MGGYKADARGSGNPPRFCALCLRRGGIFQVKLHADAALPLLRAQFSGGMDELAARFEEALAYRRFGGAERDAVRATSPPPPTSRNLT